MGLSMLLDDFTHQDMEVHRLKIPIATPQLRNWVGELRQFTEWRESASNQILRITGPFASGTSNLALHLVAQMSGVDSSPAAITLHFAFNEQFHRTRTLRDMSLSMCSQLLSKCPGLYKRYGDLCRSLQAPGILCEESLWVLLHALLSSFQGGQITLMIESIQEADIDHQALVAKLQDLLVGPSSAGKIIVTAELSEQPDQLDSCADISLFNSDLRSGYIMQSGGAQNDHIERHVPSAELLKSHLFPLSTATLTKRLQDPVASSYGTFESLLTRFRIEDITWVHFALQWILNSLTPLTIPQLTDIVVFQMRKNTSCLPATIRDNDLRLSICEGLETIEGVFIETRHDFVYPVSLVFRRFMLDRGKGLSEDPNRHDSLLCACIDFIEHKRNSPTTEGPMGGKERDWDFLGYASTFWPEHFRQSNGKSDAVQKVQAFLEKKENVDFLGKCFQSYQDACFHVSKDITALEIVCHYGIVELVELFQRQAKDEVDKTEKLKRGLDTGAFYGHLDVVTELLRHGAVSDRALGLAALGGHLAVVTKLLSTVPSVNEGDTEGFSPLHFAAARGDVNLTKILLEEKAQPDCRTKRGSTPLHFAAANGHFETVRILVAKDADITLTDGREFDALKLAARSGFTDIVRFLAQNGADVSGPKTAEKTAHNSATECRHEEPSRVSVRSYANESCTDSAGWTPLHFAANGGHLPVVRYLTEQDITDGGISCSAKTSNVSTATEFIRFEGTLPSPLHLASRNGHLDIVQELLGQPTYRRAPEICVALYYAAQESYKRVVDTLLGQHCAVIARNANGDTALHASVRTADDEILLALLKRSKIDVNARNHNGWAPIHEAAHLGIVGIFDTLKRYGGDVSISTPDGETPLQIAAKAGHAEIVRYLLSQSPRAVDCSAAFMLAVRNGHVRAAKSLLRYHKRRSQYRSGESPLHIATGNGHGDMVLLLLQNRFLADTLECSTTPLHLAVLNGSEEITEMLLKEHARPNLKDENGRTSLQLAVAINPNLTIARKLLDAGAEIDATDAEGETPLFTACYDGKQDFVELFLSRAPKPDVNHRTTFQGWTPLHAAYDCPAIIQLLLGAEADDTIETSLGKTPLDIASRDGELESVRLLLSHVQARQNSHLLRRAVAHAATWNEPTVLELLQDHGVGVQAEDEHGTTALHWAAEEGQTLNMVWLIDRGANFRKQSKLKGTPLNAGAMFPEVVELLLDRAVNPDEEGGRYHTPLQVAAMSGSVQAVRILLDRGADPNAAGGFFGTPLLAAIESEEEEVVERLLSAGANPKLRGTGEEGYDYPLHAAARSGALAILQQLMAAGAEVNRTGGKHGSALHAAIEGSSLPCVEYLLDHGAEANLEDPEKGTPAIFAAKTDDVEILKAIVNHGGNANFTDENHRSLLAHAITWKVDEVTEFLIGLESIDLSSKDILDWSPLFWAVRTGSPYVLELIKRGANMDIQDFQGMTPLMHAIAIDHLPIVRTLLENGADIRIKDTRSRSALYWACLRGCLETFEEVLKAVQKTPICDAHVASALRAAVTANRPQYLRIILESRRIDPNVSGPDGWTPLLISQMYDFPELERQLRDAGAGHVTGPFSLHCPRAWHQEDRLVNLSLDDTKLVVEVKCTYRKGIVSPTSLIAYCSTAGPVQ